MPIALSNYNLVYLKSAIEQKYQGGLEKFKKDFQFGSTPRDAEDEQLMSFARMNYEEFGSDVFIESIDYTAIGKWLRNENCSWLKENGLYCYHVDYRFSNPEFDKYITDDISIAEVAAYVEIKPLPNSF